MTTDDLKTHVRDAFPSIDYLSVRQDCLEELGQVLFSTETGAVLVDVPDRLTMSNARSCPNDPRARNRSLRPVRVVAR